MANVTIARSPGAAASALRQATSAFASADTPAKEVLQFGWMAHVAAGALWDEDRWHALLIRQVELARTVGALEQLPVDLASFAQDAIRRGDFAGADALIACFDAKYNYAFWRPITAIHAGDTDGNPDTVADPSWLPLLPGTPTHPEYPSAHSCATTGIGLTIARYLGTRRIDFTVPSLTGLGDRHFDTVGDLEYEVTNARVWGGIHYRTAIEDGSQIGKKVAHQVLAHHFHRTR